MRIFAGPNGSGKTTLVEDFKKNYSLGIFINADEIEKELRQNHKVSFSTYSISTNTPEFNKFANSSSLLAKIANPNLFDSFVIANNELQILEVSIIDSYFAALLADFVRNKIIQKGLSFSYETVMSDPRKLNFMQLAKDNNYKTYLYFISTEDSIININRVKNRIGFGGHSVPEDKIISRYNRSLELVYNAMLIVDRAFFFDNSDERVLFAEVENSEIHLHSENIPNWFRDHVLSKIDIN